MTENDHPARHLRAVTDADVPRLIMPQIADMPGAYTVRRPGRDSAEAIIARGRAAWTVMYGFDPDAADPTAQWRADTELPWGLSDGEAGRYAVELAEAYDLGVSGWHELLAAAHRAGELALSIARLHHPVKVAAQSVTYAYCRAEDASGWSQHWFACSTVRVLAGALGQTLPPDQDTD